MTKKQTIQPKFPSCNCNKCKFKNEVFVPPQKGTNLMFVLQNPGCFPKNTKVLTPYGNKNIQDLKINDIIYSKKGEYQQIKKTFLRNYNNNLYEFVLLGGYKFRCTRNHPILVLTHKKCDYGGKHKVKKYCSPCHVAYCPKKYYNDYYPQWKTADNITINDWLMLPFLNFYYNNSIKMDLDRYSIHSNSKIQIPSNVVLDEDLAYLLGWFMADGHSDFHSGVICLTLSQGRKEKYIKKICEIIENKFNVTPKFLYNKKVIQIRFFSRKLCKFFNDIFSGCELVNTKALTKQVPSIIFNSSLATISKFLFAWYLGDGSHVKNLNPVQRICTISEKAAYDCFTLFLILGIYPNFRIGGPGKKGKHDCYLIGFRNKDIKQLNWDLPIYKKMIGRELFWRNFNSFIVPIKKINKEKFNGIVYNIETEDNTYLNPFIVHNSTEATTKIPATGKTGTYLRNTLSSIDIDHNKCHITNINLCLTPNNKKPTPGEARTCGNHIWDEIEQVKPKLIILVGEVATTFCLDTTTPAKYRGLIVKKNGYNFLSIYHPSFIARNGYSKPLVDSWTNDLLKIHRFLKSEKRQYILPTRESELDKIVNLLENQPYLSVDIETPKFDRKLNPFIQDIDIYTVSFSWAKDKAVCIPLHHPENKLDIKKCEEATKKILLNNSKKIIHNVMFEYKVIKKILGIEINNIYVDTMLMQYVINPEERVGLKYLTWNYLPIGVVDFLSDDYKNDPLEDVANYNMDDSDKTLQLFNVLKSKILDDKMAWINYELMPKLATTLSDIEMNGILIDRNYLIKLDEKFGRETQELETKLLSMDKVPKGFNIRSNTQMQDLLFNKYGFIPTKKTKTGWSVDEEVINSLADKCEFCKELLNYRHKKKIHSTYIKRTLNRIDNHNKLYSSFNPMAVTGRNKSDLQQFPKKGGIREMIIAPTGYKLVSFDFSQLEVAVLAMESGDETLINLIKNGADIHASAASYVFEKPIEEITEDERYLGKNGLVFPIIYGEEPYTTAKKFGMSLEKLNKLLTKFYEMMPGVKIWRKNRINNAQRSGYVRTLLGRIRYLDYESVKSEYEVAELNRRAINTPIQSVAGDFNHYASVLLNDFTKKRNLKSKTVLVIHDEIILECPEGEIDFIIENGKRIMEGLDFGFINVPLKTNVTIGNNFGEL